MDEGMLSQFQAITNEDEGRSRFYLESANWDLNTALSSFYDTVGDFGAPEAPTPAFGRDPSPEPVPMDVEEDNKVEDKKKQSSSSRRFHSLRDYQGQEEDDDSDTEAGQEFYAGTEHSGEVIVGPRKKKSGEDIVKKMFDDAKKHGAVPVDGSAPTSQKKASNFFGGGGYKLGETSDDHQYIPGAERKPEKTNYDVVLRLWKDGFTVGDGPLRSYHDDENGEFLQAITRGEIPQELLRMAKGGEVNLDMEDHKTEEYKPPKKKIAAFSGKGQTLGSVTPTVVSVSGPPKEAPAGPPKASVDDSKPVTTVRLQLGDGSRVTQKFNHDLTLAQLYSYVRDCNTDEARTFVLMTTFPNKKLEENSSTLKECNLLNAVIVQRFV